MVKHKHIIAVPMRTGLSDSGLTKFGSTPAGGLSAGVVDGSSVAIAHGE